jgi:anti-anti-sigma regulatory factor
VLRISVEPGDKLLTLRFEGKIVGPWVEECSRVWQKIQTAPVSQKVLLDLRGVTFVDDRGIELLREIHKKSDAEVVSDSPLTEYFCERIMRKNGAGETGGD